MSDERIEVIYVDAGCGTSSLGLSVEAGAYTKWIRYLVIWVAYALVIQRLPPSKDDRAR